MDLRSRFDEKWTPEPNTGCHLWTGAVQSNGYGRAWDGKRVVYAHRLALKLAGVPLKKGLVVDHKCRVRCCVDPAHLRQVTQGENLMCGDTLTAANAAKTHCKRGHEFTEANTIKSGGGRACRTCVNTAKRERRSNA